jgi:transcriptional regulator with XRE-family HTH domain
MEGVIMNKEYDRIIGANLRSLREKAGLTQEQVSVKMQVGGCDITRSAVAKIEVGQRHLYPDEILLLKDILETEYDEIFSPSEVAVRN